MYVLYCNIPFLVFLSESEKDEHILYRVLEKKETLVNITSFEVVCFVCSFFFFSFVFPVLSCVSLDHENTLLFFTSFVFFTSIQHSLYFIFLVFYLLIRRW